MTSFLDRRRSELHHWWPRSLSQFWADASGHTHCVDCNGELVRSLPKQFGAVRNDHHILAGDEPSVWDFSFESSFAGADESFVSLITWLQEKHALVPARDGPITKERLTPVAVSPQERARLAECASSLIVRSPGLKNRIRVGVESLRSDFGLADPSANRELVNRNIAHGQRHLTGAMSKSGKFAILHAGESEFIFGDGFAHNVSFVSNTNHSIRYLLPLTPEVAVFYCSPMSYRSYPIATSINLNPDEVEFVNFTVQVYSKRFLFFREIHPILSEAFQQGEHLQFEYDNHAWMKAFQEVLAESYFGPDHAFAVGNL